MQSNLRHTLLQHDIQQKPSVNSLGACVGMFSFFNGTFCPLDGPMAATDTLTTHTESACAEPTATSARLHQLCWYVHTCLGGQRPVRPITVRSNASRHTSNHRTMAQTVHSIQYT
jgi:hypothetical protein